MESSSEPTVPSPEGIAPSLRIPTPQAHDVPAPSPEAPQYVQYQPPQPQPQPPQPPYSPYPHPPYPAYPPPPGLPSQPQYPPPANPSQPLYPAAQNAPTLPGSGGGFPPALPNGVVPAPPPLPPAVYTPFAPPFTPPARDQGGGLAIAALILGIFAIICSLFTVCDLPFVAVGIIFGVLGHRSLRHGKLATAGVVLSVIGFALAVIFFLFELSLSSTPPV